MIRSVTFEVRVLRSGAQLARLRWPDELPPTVYASASAAVKASLSGTFFPAPEMDLARDELQAVMIEDGVETPIGVFVPTTATDVRDGAARMVQLQAYDRTYYLSDTRTASTLCFAAGRVYTAVINELVTLAGSPAALVVPSDKVLATDRADWPMGTDVLTIANDLLREIGYAPIWADPRGFLRAAPAPALDGSRIDWVYTPSGTPAQRLTAGGSSRSDLWSRPNVFVLICANPDLPAPLVATAKNENPVSASSILRRGREIVTVQQVDNVPDQAALQAMADRICRESMMGTQTVTFETPLQAGHGIGDVVAIQHPDFTGLFRETAWSMDLRAGAIMQHTAERMMPNA